MLALRIIPTLKLAFQLEPLRMNKLLLASGLLRHVINGLDARQIRALDILITNLQHRAGRDQGARRPQRELARLDTQQAVRTLGRAPRPRSAALDGVGCDHDAVAPDGRAVGYVLEDVVGLSAEGVVFCWAHVAVLREGKVSFLLLLLAKLATEVRVVVGRVLVVDVDLFVLVEVGDGDAAARDGDVVLGIEIVDVHAWFVAGGGGVVITLVAS